MNVVIDTHHSVECECGKCKTIDNEKLLAFLQENQYTPCFIEQGGSDILEKSWKHTVTRPIFIYGSEHSGIPLDTMRYIQKHIPDTRILSIQQVGIMRSHNVTSACTLVVWEYVRQKLIDKCPS
jgi:tRNA(Leu) C34 or U34 (ribose-2'-O)-methylase TrmL